MPNSMKWLMVYVVGVFGIVACSGGPQTLRTTDGADQIPQTVEELAGAWEYVDSNGTFLLVLNEQGGGSYDWKGGRLETIELKDGVWKGKWYQAENDREGGFRLLFSADTPVAEGKWWYTRIGDDTHPLEPGGEFMLKQLPEVMKTER